MSRECITLLRTLSLSVTGRDFPTLCTIPYGTRPNRHSSASAASEPAPVISSLLSSSLQPWSLPTYQRAWKLFHLFLHATFPSILTSFPISPSILALLTAYMYNHHYAYSTVHTFVSALGYCHMLSGLQIPRRSFLSFRCSKAIVTLVLV